ncbi:hypothetical protein AVEN_223469-1 [Araneus ventricosus]|uniref:Uncharacterized protein n=1 Tax=Araneus ventricosus TaxID=182803 RepID=A0A4Y2EXE3_ARAVE|nr:hypothetical protein AVEN_223469-1 [Araneus ventricosus]
MFHNIFATVPERPVGNSDILHFVLDGGSLHHRVVWSKQETFATDDADLHIVKTAIETYEKIKKQVVVIGQDVDLLVLLNALTPDYIEGRGGLVVRSRPRDRGVAGSKPDSTEDPPCMGPVAR